jgi:hypothetical protein
MSARIAILGEQMRDDSSGERRIPIDLAAKRAYFAQDSSLRR